MRRWHRGTSAEFCAFLCVGVALLFGPGCGIFHKGPLPAPSASGLRPAGEGVRVALLWKAPVDLDLYVTDPALETVYFANTPSGSGGKLEKDVQCSAVRATRGADVLLESAVWLKAPPGRYRVGVDFMNPCDNGDREVEFRVVADAASWRMERVGRLSPARFEPIVLEFDVPEASGGESAPSVP